LFYEYVEFAVSALVIEWSLKRTGSHSMCIRMAGNLIVCVKAYNEKHERVDSYTGLYRFIAPTPHLLPWMTNWFPSVIWHCWFGHLAGKIIPEMTYNVLSGTLSIHTTTTLDNYCLLVQIIFKMVDFYLFYFPSHQVSSYRMYTYI